MTELSTQIVKEAAALIKKGELVAMPTETVYGLSADATNDLAIAKVFKAKERPHFNPLISHVTGLEMAQDLAVFNDLATRLAKAFWPGPLTLILPRSGQCPVSALACAGLDTIGVRAPDHPIALELIRAVGGPLCAPSANPSGAISPTKADHVVAGLGKRVSAIIDGGTCRIGLESTILKIENDDVILLRPGGLPLSQIEDVIAKPLITAKTYGTIEAPGMMSSHYAPSVKLRIHAKQPNANEAYLAFGPGNVFAHSLNLSPSGNSLEAGANLFAMLHQLDALCQLEKLDGIAVAPIPTPSIEQDDSRIDQNSTLYEAINDRLQRAAAPRTSR